MDVLRKGDRRLRLLFIQSKTENPEGPVFPLGIGYLTAILPPEFQVHVVDANIDPHFSDTIRKVSEEFKPDLVCVSIRNIKVARPGEHISGDRDVKDLCRNIKHMLPGTPILAGGAAFSLYAQPLMKAIPEIDYGIVGEGETALSEFLKKFPDPAGIDGILYRQDGGLKFQGIARRPDFAALPWPERKIVPIDRYRKHPTGIGVMTKRGCPYRCIHCSDLYLLGGKIRKRFAGDIVEELRCLKKDFGVTRFMFADQEFNIPSNYTKELLRHMIHADLGMEWTAYFTPDGLDREMVDLFKRSGCFMMNFSPDCCGDRMMKNLGKGYSVKQIHRANRLAKQAGIPVTYNFMLGLPGQRLSDLLRTILFVLVTKLRLRRFFKLHGLFIVPVRIYPWTKLRELAVREAIIEPGDDLMHPRFYRSKNKFLAFADNLLIKLISLLWKLKHRII